MRRQRGVIESVGSIVLGFEFIVVILGGLAGFGLRVVHPAYVALIFGVALALLLVVTIPLLRFSWGVWVGWFVELLVIVSGVWVHMMIAVGVIFVAIWAYAITAGARAERQRQAHFASTAVNPGETAPGQTEPNPDRTEHPS